MFDTLDRAVTLLRSALDVVDVDALDGDAAARLFGVFAAAERLAVAGKTLTAGVVDRSDVWRRAGHRSAASWMAATAGDSLGRAQGALETAVRLERLSDVVAEVRSGGLSESQVREVAAAAVVAPDRQCELLTIAQRESAPVLRAACRTVIAEATATDERAAYERVRQSRNYRSWTAADGAYCFGGRLTADAGARVEAELVARRQRVFDEARTQGRREPFEAYMADAFVEAVTGEHTGPAAMVHVRIDHAALVRGHVEPGEMCEIPGIGPIPVATARWLLDDAILRVIVTKGVDIAAVAHADRTITASLRTALEARSDTCEVPGCPVRLGLEIDHAVDVALGGPSTLANTRRMCHWHHYLKTHCGYRLEGDPGQRRWLSPDGHEPEPAPTSDLTDALDALAQRYTPRC